MKTITTLLTAALIGGSIASQADTAPVAPYGYAPVLPNPATVQATFEENRQAWAKHMAEVARVEAERFQAVHSLQHNAFAEMQKKDQEMRAEMARVHQQMIQDMITPPTPAQLTQRMEEQRAADIARMEADRQAIEAEMEQRRKEADARMAQFQKEADERAQQFRIPAPRS